MRVNDALLGALLIALAVALALYAQTFPNVPGQEYGAAVFPTLVAIGLLGSGALLVRSGLRSRAPAIAWADWARERHGVRNVRHHDRARRFLHRGFRPPGLHGGDCADPAGSAQAVRCRLDDEHRRRDPRDAPRSSTCSAPGFTFRSPGASSHQSAGGDSMEAIEQAVELVFQLDVLTTILGSAMFGLFVGAIPGLTATMAIALLVPVTFFMDPVPAIGAMVTCSAMAIFAGDIPATLLRIPGTPASAAYTEEAYAMTRNGAGGAGARREPALLRHRRALRNRGPHLRRPLPRRGGAEILLVRVFLDGAAWADLRRVPRLRQRR